MWRGVIEQIAKKNVTGLFDYLEETGATVCGRYPIGVLLSILPADAEMHVLRYDTSGHITGDYANSVSYYAIGFCGRWGKAERVAPETEAAEQ